MREMDKIVHDVPHEPVSPAPTALGDEEDEAALTAEEKSLRFEVGYLAPDHTLKPLVELDRAQVDSLSLGWFLSSIIVVLPSATYH